MKKIVPLIVLCLLASVCLGQEPVARPAKWAQTVKLTGVPNLHRVSNTLYRSAQPTAEGMKNLQALGIRTVVNLRSFHSDQGIIGNTGLEYEHINMQAWQPKEEEVIRFLRIAADQQRAPVLVHCQHGADRTGTMCAVYRVAVEGWTKEEAIKEMTGGGFGFHSIWENLPEWITALDIESIRTKAGLKATPAKGGSAGMSRQERNKELYPQLAQTTEAKPE